jgi:hypothetical protein
MVELDCARLREVGAELALGVLPDLDRAEALAHLENCPACEQHVRDLTAVGDRLAGLTPGVEPPLGFDGRVLRRLGYRGRRRWLAASLLVLAVAVAVGGWLLRAVYYDEVSSTTIMAEGHQVGEVFTYTDGQPWVYVELTALPPVGTAYCQLVLADGRVIDVGAFPVAGGTGAWGGPAPLAETDLAEVRILTPDGALLATGRFA